MKVSAPQSPDKPASFLKKNIRLLLRELRWLRVGLTNWRKVSRGKNCYFGSAAEIYVPQRLIMGQNISIGSNFILQTDARIGSDTLISSRVSFIGNDHDLFSVDKTAYFSGRNPPATIVLEGNNFIGFGATVLGSVTIGKDSIVAACSFVNKDVPPNSIVAGVPAKVIGCRYK